MATQLPIYNIDCPKSGWSINKIIIELNRIKLKKYFTWEFWNLFRVNILTVIKIKKGFNISIGCNLKKYRSIHRLAPFTSIPIIGTSAKSAKEIANRGTTSLISTLVLIIEIVIIVSKAKEVNTRCFVKKK